MCSGVYQLVTYPALSYRIAIDLVNNEKLVGRRVVEARGIDGYVSSVDLDTQDERNHTSSLG